MKIGITGAQGTGKTTLASILAEVLGIPLITEQVRKVAKDMGIESLKKVRADIETGGVFQEACLKYQLSVEQGLSDFISDRTTIDNAVYWLKHHAHHWPSQVSIAYYRDAFRNIRNYNLILYVPPELEPIDDGFRDMGREHQLEIDFYIRCFLSQSGANYITVSGSIEERVERVLYEISRG